MPPPDWSSIQEGKGGGEGEGKGDRQAVTERSDVTACNNNKTAIYKAP